MTPSTSHYLDIRGLRYHVRCWGRQDAPKLILLHGWMDVSASFQFMVDELRGDWRVLAPDWRGYGLTSWTGAESYWFPDYYADLDRILDHFSPDQPLTLVGHSMGGNIGCTYAGIRPERIARLVNLEGFSMPNFDPAVAPSRFAQWLRELRETQRFRDYASFDELAARMMKSNPRLTPERATFLASHWGRMGDDGRVSLQSDPRHRIVNPVLPRLAEQLACLARITAPVLWVEGASSDTPDRLKLSREDIETRKAAIPRRRDLMIPDAGHMLHHDQPRLLARGIEDFLASA